MVPHCIATATRKSLKFVENVNRVGIRQIKNDVFALQQFLLPLSNCTDDGLEPVVVFYDLLSLPAQVFVETVSQSQFLNKNKILESDLHAAVDKLQDSASDSGLSSKLKIKITELFNQPQMSGPLKPPLQSSKSMANMALKSVKLKS